MIKLKAYYAALKPERTYANVMTTGAGFLFACKWHISWVHFLAVLVGSTLIVMSACGVNNCIDRELDARMPRTKQRATATGEVPARNLLTLAAILGLAGFVVLIVKVNWLTVLLGAIGYIDYVLLYAWTKRTTPWSTLIGTVSGAVPIVAGYTAATGRFDIAAFLLGLVMVLWQMPHFFAIGIFRLKDYKLGRLPIWPVRYGVQNTQIWMLAYTALFIIAVLLLDRFGSAGIVFAVVMSLSGLYWLVRGIKGFRDLQPEKWARGMFGLSLLILLVLTVGVSVSPFLP